MGGKRSGRGKPFHLCLAVLILLGASACAPQRLAGTRPAESPLVEAAAHLARGRQLLARGEYTSALAEQQQALLLAGRNRPADEALFYTGVIQLLPANPERNPAKAAAAFARVVREHPGSPLTDQARAFLDLLREREQLRGEAERLHRMIDELKKVDIRIDQKKREQNR